MSALHYIEDSTFAQVKPPQWNRNFTGELDTCAVTYQGAQYRAKAFMDSLGAYATLSCTDEAGANLNDASMFLDTWTSDDNPVLPTVTLNYKGLRGGAARGVLAEDDTSLQTAQTTKQITDSTSVNYQKTITCSVTYVSSRTTYKWAALANPGSTPNYSAVRNIPVLNMRSAAIRQMTFSGMVDDAGEPTDTISTGDATAVFNTFSAVSQTTTFTVPEVVPGKLWQCQSVNEYILKGA
jgi:hypothetical protein